MRSFAGVRTELRGAAVLFIAACLSTTMLGCFSGKFFVPPCQGPNCGGGGANSSYAYVANASQGTVTGFPLPTASFTSVTGTSYALGTTPRALVGNPNGKFLYVATSGIVAGSIFLYTIGSNGALTLGNGSSPVATAINPTSMTVDPSGSWLFVVSSISPTLLEFQINSTTGLLTQVGTGTALNAGTPMQVAVTPNNQYVYVGLGTGGVDVFTLNASSGALSNHLHVAARPAGADNTLVADNTSSFLLVGEAGQGIRTFTIGTGGALAEVAGSPFQSQLGPASIVVDSTNSYVYVANKTANVITGYTLGATGTLTPLASSPFSSGTGPISMSLDSTGKYLLAINNGGGPDLQIFSFDPTDGGNLIPVASAATGTDPAGAISLSVVP